MLITDYLVGRDEKGRFVCLSVKDVLPVDCEPGRTDLVVKLTRQDLVQEFVQDGVPVDWITFPDLPVDVVELLRSGESLIIRDEADALEIECLLADEVMPLVVGDV